MNSWSNKFLSKFDETQDKLELLIDSINKNKLELLVNSINKDCFWDSSDLADQLLMIEEDLDEINDKIDNLQHQLDTKKINPSNKEKDRVEEYDIQQNILKSIFPIMLHLNDYYRNKSSNKSINKNNT